MIPFAWWVISKAAIGACTVEFRQIRNNQRPL
jgi:hypothetical protein